MPGVKVFWTCTWCSKLGEGRPPTLKQPRRCHWCGHLVWPDGRFLVDDQRGRIIAVRLIEATSAPLTVLLQAEIQPNGDLVVSGQHLGRGVESIWGDMDYEYWLTIRSPRLSALIEGLSRALTKREAPPSDVSYLYATEALANPDNGLADDHPRLALLLLRSAFRAGMFASDVELREWLKRKRIPSEFFSYV